MIVVKLSGGLGNQLFQYSAGRRLALEQDTKLKLDISEYEKNKHRKYCLDQYNIEAEIAETLDLLPFGIIRGHRFLTSYTSRVMGRLHNLLGSKYLYLNEAGYGFQVLPAVPDSHLYLDGYWQSYKYFNQISGPLSEELTLRKDSDQTNKQMQKRIQECEAVSVHIRRGDYVTDRAANQTHGICSMEYYQKAARLVMEKNPNAVFFFFSDDMDWVKENLHLDGAMQFVSINGDDKNYEDLNLMQQCRHHIIANSTFSWWGAWLGRNPNKMVIAPARWFNTDYPVKDLIPENWIRI